MVPLHLELDACSVLGPSESLNQPNGSACENLGCENLGM